MLDNLKSFFEAILAGDMQAIILLASIYFAVMGLVSLISCIRIRSWPTTSGVLLHSGLDTLGLGMRSDEHNYTADVRYSYRVAGKDYEGNRLSPTLYYGVHKFAICVKLAKERDTEVGRRTGGSALQPF